MSRTAAAVPVIFIPCLRVELPAVCCKVEDAFFHGTVKCCTVSFGVGGVAPEFVFTLQRMMINKSDTLQLKCRPVETAYCPVDMAAQSK
jgi:hypothetical protein